MPITRVNDEIRTQLITELMDKHPYLTFDVAFDITSIQLAAWEVDRYSTCAIVDEYVVAVNYRSDGTYAWSPLDLVEQSIHTFPQQVIVNHDIGDLAILLRSCFIILLKIKEDHFSSVHPYVLEEVSLAAALRMTFHVRDLYIELVFLISDLLVKTNTNVSGLQYLDDPRPLPIIMIDIATQHEQYAISQGHELQYSVYPEHT